MVLDQLKICNWL